MEQLLCQSQCPAQSVTAGTLTLPAGMFSAFTLSATTVSFTKKSGKEQIVQKESTILRK
nr:hypothetical protein [uncultured Prevotella sp.]